ncbi:6568_t:CDS:2, partial [Gigaspora rosea]
MADDPFEDENDSLLVSFVYTISQEIVCHLNDVASIIIIKHSSTLDPNRPVQSQIQFFNLLGSVTRESGSTNVSPYESLHSCIHHIVAPYFDAYFNAKSDNAESVWSNKKCDDAKMDNFYSMFLIKFSYIYHDNQIFIFAKKAVEKAKQEGRRFSIDIIDRALLLDDAFLNRLQDGVDGWIKEIQK